MVPRVSFSLMETMSQGPILALRTPLCSVEPHKKWLVWDAIKAGVVARVAAVFISVFAAVDASVHLLTGVYKESSLLFRNICHLTPSSYSEEEIHSHFKRAAWFSLITVIGSVVGGIHPIAFSIPPIVYCNMREAVFSQADKKRPIIATDSLATCVGVAGYDRAHKVGFVVHFPTEDEVEKHGDKILETLKGLVGEEIRPPIEIHLRGGTLDMSEPCVDAIKQWLASAEKKGCPIQIISENLLQTSGCSSLALDTRDGTISCYDRTRDPNGPPTRTFNNFKDAYREAFMTALLDGSRMDIIANGDEHFFKKFGLA